jgi:hypothetical protein
MTSTTVPQSTTSQAAHRNRDRALAVLGAVLAVLAVWVVAVPLLGADLLVRTGDQTRPVGVGSVVAISLVAGLLAWALLALLERRPGGRQRWTAVAVVLLVLSLSGPLTAGETAAAKAGLVLLHLAVAAVLIPGLRRTTPSLEQAAGT